MVYKEIDHNKQYAVIEPYATKRFEAKPFFDITHANIMHEVLGKKKKPVKITGEITRNLAGEIPIPNLMINTDWLDDIKKEQEREKFKPIVNQGDVAWNFNENFKGTGKITNITNRFNYEHGPQHKVTIEAIILDR